jgi:HAMP domain-containing protein
VVPDLHIFQARKLPDDAVGIELLQAELHGREHDVASAGGEQIDVRTVVLARLDPAASEFSGDLVAIDHEAAAIGVGHVGKGETSAITDKHLVALLGIRRPGAVEVQSGSLIRKCAEAADDTEDTSNVARFVHDYREAAEARRLLGAIAGDSTTPSDHAALARIEARIESAMLELRRQLAQEDRLLLQHLDAGEFDGVRRALTRVDLLRDQFIQKIDGIRADMFAQVLASTSSVIRAQQQTLIMSAIVTALAAILGLGIALLVAAGITRPVRLLLEGTRQVAAGRLDRAISISTRDEIGELSAAFNEMVEQLRRNERIRETFGRYIDPKIVEGLVEQPEIDARRDSAG